MKNKTVLITGSSRGIGKAISEKFINNNFNVVINCKNNLNLLEDQINKFSNKNILAIQADVSIYNECKNMMEKIKNTFGSIDILINNAGISLWKPFNLNTPDEWDTIIKNNFISVLNCSHLVIPYMLEKKSGKIINISSIWGNVGASCEVVYSSTKGAVNSFTKALAKELGPSNINVNAISCGVINTDMNNWLSDYEKNSLIEEIPLCRLGETEEIANLAYFLASDEANYITGQIIGVDGGII